MQMAPAAADSKSAQSASDAAPEEVDAGEFDRRERAHPGESRFVATTPLHGPVVVHAVTSARFSSSPRKSSKAASAAESRSIELKWMASSVVDAWSEKPFVARANMGCSESSRATPARQRERAERVRRVGQRVDEEPQRLGVQWRLAGRLARASARARAG